MKHMLSVIVIKVVLLGTYQEALADLALYQTVSDVGYVI